MRRACTLLAIIVSIITSLNVTGATATESQIEIAPQLVSGAFHNCVLSNQGKVTCWGGEQTGSVPSDLGVAVQVSAGYDHTCALNTSGEIRCWGANWMGQLNVPSDLVATQVSAGNQFTCALTTLATVKCWGYNFNGTTEVPNYVRNIKQISAGFANVCALDLSGVVQCWGGNRLGALDVPGNLGNVIQISVGQDRVCALNDLGVTSCWGDGRYGQNDIPSNIQKVTQISGKVATCAVTDSNTEMCWGSEAVAENIPSDLGPVLQTSVGTLGACALLITGSVRCWGRNWFGENNIPNDLNASSMLKRIKSSPVPLTKGTFEVGSRLFSSPGNWDPGVQLDYQWLRDGSAIEEARLPEYVPTLSDLDHYISVRITGHAQGYISSSQTSAAELVKSGSLELGPSRKNLSAGMYTSCAVDSNHDLQCWGPKDTWVALTPTSNRDLLSVSVGNGHACLLSIQKTVVCWGWNSYGQATPPSDLPSVEQVSAGNQNSCAVTIAHDLRCWGITPVSTPDKVESVSVGNGFTCFVNIDYQARCLGSDSYQQSSPPTELGPVKTISAGSDHACAVTKSSRVRCWGYNGYGQTDVPNNLEGVNQVSAGGDHTCALKYSGEVSCWGRNGQGQTSVPQNLGPAVEISAGGSNTCAQTVEGKVVCWGGDFYNQSSPPTSLVMDNSNTKTVWLSGAPKAGYSLAISDGTWNSFSNATFQWYRNGVQLTQTGNTYALTLADLGSEIIAKATYSKLGYRDFSVVIAPLQINATVANTTCSASLDSSTWLMSSTTQPTISGIPKYGSRLSGAPGSWASGTKFCSYWYENGQAIPGALGASYKIQPSDVGNQMQYVVIGTDKSGKSGLRYSQPITISKATFTSAKAPKIVGVGKVGTKLSGSVTNWAAGVNYSYQWLRNGNPIEGAQSRTYVATSDDLGTALTFQTCGSKEYYETLCLTSSGISVTKGTISPAPSVKILGSSTKPGAVLTGVAGNWPSGAALAIQWFRDGSPIQGETQMTYTISQSDRGHSITFQVTATASGYTDCVKVSVAKKIP